MNFLKIIAISLFLCFPTEMFTPPEIPLSGYTPPRTDAYLPKTTSSSYPHQYENTYAPPPSNDYYQSSSGAPQGPPSFRKLDPSQVYGAQFPVQNFTPKPFTPSPIAQVRICKQQICFEVIHFIIRLLISINKSQEKLAIFEQQPTYLPQPVIRRPLTVPNQRVKNVSPTPFGGGSAHFDSYQSAPW